MFGAELADLIVDLVPDLARLFQFFFVRAGGLRWIRKRPMQPSSDARENWAAFRFRFVANGNDVSEQFSRLEDVEHGLRFVFRNVDVHFAEDFDCEWIERARL